MGLLPSRQNEQREASPGAPAPGEACIYGVFRTAYRDSQTRFLSLTKLGTL